MKTAPILIAVAIAAISTSTHAFRYEAQLNSSSTESETEFDDATDRDVESDILSLDATYYFKNVSIKNGPWEEAAFLSKASSVSLGYGQLEEDDKADDSFFSDTNIKADGEIQRLAFRAIAGAAVFEGTYSKTDYELSTQATDQFSVSVGDMNSLGIPIEDRQSFTQALNEDPAFRDLLRSIGVSIESSFVFSESYEDEEITLSAGGYIGDHQQWWVRGRSGETADYSKFRGLGGGYKNVFSTGEQSHLSIQVSLDISDVEEFEKDFYEAELNVGVAYYPIDELAISAQIQSIAGLEKDAEYDDDDADYSRVALSVGVSYYPIEQLYLTASVSSATFEYNNYGINDNLNGEIDSVSLNFGIGVRF